MKKDCLQLLKTCFLLASSFCGLKNYAQTTGYEIDGHIDGLNEGEKVVMKLFQNGTEIERRDSGYVSKGIFHLAGTVPQGPRLYWMIFEHHRKYAVLLINNGEKVRISGSDIEKMGTRIQNDIVIEGSPTMTAALRMQSGMMQYSGTIPAINRELKKIKDSIGYNQNLVTGLMLAKDYSNWSLVNSVIDMFRATRTVPYFLDEFSPYINHASLMAAEYERLNNEEKESYYGKVLKEIAVLCVGQRFPEFKLPDAQGNLMSLKDVISKNKMTIVHFWASNSFERKKYQDELRFFYGKYQDKGLAIVGISSDTNAIEWRVRLEAEKYPWYNVSDLKGYNGLVEKTYHEYGFPEMPNTTNVLINSEGEIVAWDVNGVELQWYLNKYLDNNATLKDTIKKGK